MGHFEFRCRNEGQNNIIIESLTLESIRDAEKEKTIITKLPFMAPGIPLDQQISFSRPDPALFCRGFHFPEAAGRWAAKNASLEIHFSELPKKKVLLIFTLAPLTKDQIMIVKSPDGKLLKTFEVSRKGTYVLPLGQEYFEKYGRKARLDFSFPRAKSPGTADERVLSCAFESLEARLCNDLNVGQEIVFSAFSKSYLTGFSAAESWGVWSNAQNCVMRFSLPPNRRSEEVHLQFTCQAYNRMKSVKVYCNGKYAAEWKIRKFSPDVYELKLNVPLTERNVELRFEQFDVASPYEVSGTADHRKLGLGFISMRYLPAAN